EPLGRGPPTALDFGELAACELGQKGAERGLLGNAVDDGQRARLVTATRFRDQAIPAVGAQERPRGHRANVRAATTSIERGAPNVGQPTRLLPGRASEVRFRDDYRTTVALMRSDQDAGGAEQPLRA